MEDVDASLRTDEIEALSSIYGNDLIQETSSSEGSCYYSVIVRNDANTIQLQLLVNLPLDYPTSAPPIFEISSPNLDGKAKTMLSSRLQEIYMENLGQPILYHWIEASRLFLNEYDSEGSKTIATFEEIDSPREPQPSIPSNIDQNLIKSGEPLTDRKSTFQAHLAPVSTKDDVRNVLDFLKTNPKFARATHNMFAYRIHDGGRICIQDCEDDGENQAGSRLLHLLDMMDARNVLVVVSRWYGGTHLGPDRFKHISNVAREILEKNGYGKQQSGEAKKMEKKK